MGSEALRILNLEDNENDALLIELTLRREGFAPEIVRVDTETDFLAALAEGVDLILADHSLPDFSSTRALKFLKEHNIDLPFIIVSGVITEELAVEALRNGADDYVLKNRLHRLGTTIERVLKEYRLREHSKITESLLHGVLQSTLDGVVVLEAVCDEDDEIVDFEFVLVNPSGAALIGRPAEEITGSFMRKTYPSDTLAQVFDTYCQVMQTGQPAQKEIYILLNGRQRWLDLTAVRVSSGVAVTFRDITDQKSASERLRSILASVPSALLSINQQGIITHANQQVETIFGYQPSMLIGQSMNVLIPEFADNMYAYEGQPLPPHYARETQGLKKDGKPIPIEFHLNPVDFNDGDMHLLCAVNDVSYRKEAEALLVQSEERWRLLVENSPLPVLITVENVVVYINEAGLRILKANDASDVVGHDAAQFIAPDYHYIFDLEPSGDALPATNPLRCKYLCLDGEERYVEAFYAPISYQDQDAWQTVVRDVTEQHRYEMALIEAKEFAEQMNQLKMSFLTNMNHELRTPLTSILGFAEVLAEGLDEEKAELVDIIHRSGERLLETLRSVLDLAQIESGHIELRHEMINVAQLTRQTLSAMRSAANRKGIYLKVELATEEAEAWMDGRAFTRILQNLVDNAIKFTEQGGVTVRLWDDEEWVYVRIADTGIGIAHEFLPHLFTEFKQESTGLSRNYEGTGLGLTIAKRLVDTISGTIDVSSEKGQGSVFTVTLPKLSDVIAVLTPREREIFHLVQQGLSSAHISERLFISPRTVETHRYNIMKKLHIDSPSGLLRYSLKHLTSSSVMNLNAGPHHMTN